MNPFGIQESFDPNNDVDRYDAVKISLASPEQIRKWSYGEVKNPETINYRTYRPERDGLFCERIFGPTHDWECACGKYKRVKHKGVICDRCGVEVTLAKVRRQRMGHIELAVPVSHIWFLKCTPSRIGLMLDMTAGSLEKVLYYESYLVTNEGGTPLKKGQLLDDDEYLSYREQYGDAFEAFMGAEGVQKLLSEINLEEMMDNLVSEIESTKSKQTRKKVTKRMKVCNGFLSSNTRPENMILTVMPVIPPELRPLVPLDGGRFATSDLNDLYRRVINRNNRLRNQQSLKTPDVIIRNEKRMLQEAVDTVFDNGRHGRAVAGPGNRPLKSLSDMLKGKTGRFRQNLLGKRVDYSGRSVIICGPELKLYQCGLPKKMALILFEPFIIRRLKEKNLAHTVKSAKRLIEKRTNDVWDALDTVTAGKTVMLNRAPTLHRLSIQSFEPVLVEGEAIKLHPMVCTAFNADFDGDQMAVHVPLSIEAQLESRLLMLSSNSIFSPASGNSIMTPTQDIALGVYYITVDGQIDRMRFKHAGEVSPEAERLRREKLPLFNDNAEVKFAFDDGALKVHSRIMLKNPDFGRDTKYGDKTVRVIETTVGRVFFNEIWPDTLGFVNRKVDKSFLGEMIWQCNYLSGHDVTIMVLDKLKDMGYSWATIAGVSIGLGDMNVPVEKASILRAAQAEVDNIRRQFADGVITEKERHNKVVDVWSSATEQVAEATYRGVDVNGWTPEHDDSQEMEINPIFMMVDSKARGSKQQVRQLAGMRGCMADPSGNIIETPIRANFREGLSIFEFFISSHGARKGLADTALKTADAGYLTRKLVDVAQNVIVTEEDCGTVNGITVTPVYDGDKVVVPLRHRILGRTSLDQIRDPVTQQVVVDVDQEIDEKACDELDRLEVESITIRSPLKCNCRHGICAKCYGRDLATGKHVEIGTAVGIIAAQSIGEPGTQLTMRTFHLGGVASTSSESSEFVAKSAGTLRYSENIRFVQGTDSESGKTMYVVLNKNTEVSIVGEDGSVLETFNPPNGARLFHANGEAVSKGDLICNWDPYATPIVSEVSGTVDVIEGGAVRISVGDDSVSYAVPGGAVITVKEGDSVSPGDVIAKIPKSEAKTRDITGGLPRVSELFEARSPKDKADIAAIDGVVDFGKSERGRRVLIISDPATKSKATYNIPFDKHCTVVKGDFVRKGQSLTEGPIDPKEYLELCGIEDVQNYLVQEVQAVYRIQGVDINEKHIETIVRQMLRQVRITEPGDTDFLWGEHVSRVEFSRENEKAIAEGKQPAEASPILLGITKAALETDSFISAASFQDTTRVLTESASEGKVDTLRGFKENVILGHLVPGGTGFLMNRLLKLRYFGDPIPEEDMPKSEEDDRLVKAQLN